MTNQTDHCPNCASEDVLFSKKRNANVCEDCGHAWAAEKSIIALRLFLSYGNDGNEELLRRITAALTITRNRVAFARGNLVKVGRVQAKAEGATATFLSNGIL